MAAPRLETSEVPYGDGTTVIGTSTAWWCRPLTTIIKLLQPDELSSIRNTRRWGKYIRMSSPNCPCVCDHHAYRAPQNFAKVQRRGTTREWRLRTPSGSDAEWNDLGAHSQPNEGWHRRASSDNLDRQEGVRLEDSEQVACHLATVECRSSKVVAEGQ